MMESLLKEVQKEMDAQVIKWGEQSHPCLDQTLLNRPGGCGPRRMALNYEIPTETRAKFMCENAARNGEVTWTHIALEEFTEIVGAENDLYRRGELIQLAAVCLSWVKDIDKR